MRSRYLLAALLASGVAYGQPSNTPPAPAPANPAPAPANPVPPPTNQPAPNPVPVKEGPATAPGLGQPRPVPVNVAPVQLTPEDKKALADVEDEYEHFRTAANQHDTRMREMAKREYDSRTGELEKRYAERIAKTEQDKSKRHADTMAQLEKFLQNHPTHEQFTPDAMFRLATLYLDQAEEEVEQRFAAQEKGGDKGTDQAAILADYSKSLALWEDILKRFPHYRQTPSTLYLLAYYSKTKDERKSLQVFLALTCANRYKWDDKPPAVPDKKEALKRADSRTLRDPYGDCKPYEGSEVELIRHAWVRGIADSHFAVPGELDEAIAAYRKVADGGQDSKLYAESMYKLAWSYYKRDFLEDSIKEFDKSVKLYDSIVAKGDPPALELRDESIQYIAVAFTDPWPGEKDTDPAKAFDRAKKFYAGRENEPHVRDVWVAMGKAFTELQAWNQAVDAYRIAIGPPWELNPNNPVVHQEIVNAFESKGDKFAADAAAAELATRYAPGTAWYAANEKDREAMDNQRRIAERALYAATRNTHSAATQMRKDWEATAKKDPAQKQDWLAMYSKSVDLYRTFIRTYPESDYIYEFSFLEGEALYWSERYAEAIEQYKWVRDHRDLGTAYYIDAARSVTQSYEKLAEIEVAAGRLQPLKVLTAAELKALPQPLQPQPIPSIYVNLQQEWDNYQNIVQDPKAAPQQGINAALVSFAYLHMDDAISRFRKVMDKFCGLPEASKAKDGMLSIYEATDQLDQFKATNAAFINQKCGDDKAIKLAREQNQSLEFSYAKKAYDAKDYLGAASAYYRFYKTAPNDNKDLPVALYNAAVSEKLGDHPKTAISLFQEFTKNTSKAFKESPYYLDAVRLTAASYQAAFDYDNAVKTYLDLYDLTKKAKRLGIKPPEPLPGEKAQTLDEIGLNALYNAAFAAELNRDFKKATELYNQYGAVEPDRRKKDRAQWSIAGIYRQAGDAGSMVDALDKWRAKFGRDPGNEDDFVQSYYDTATLWKRKGRTPQAKAAGEEAIKAWKQRGAIKGGRGAKLAGEWDLTFAEDFYQSQWQPLAFKTAARSKAEFEGQTKKLKDLKAKTEDRFRTLDVYGVAEVTMAATVRYGDVQYDFALKSSDIPIPKVIESVPSAVEKFEQTRDENLKKFLSEARQSWQLVVDKAKTGGISNKWSDHALENLAREFPDEFKALRAPVVEGTSAP
jgi:tetratricopeptide (TPR) repeat protein